MFNYFFMNEVCYANEGDSQKERTWRPLLLLDCTDCSNPPPSTPAPQSVLFEGGGTQFGIFLASLR